MAHVPPDLLAALRAAPEALAKWDALPDEERERYVRWVDGPRLVRGPRIRGTVGRVRHDLPQRNFWRRMLDGSRVFSEELGSGQYGSGAGTGTTS